MRIGKNFITLSSDGKPQTWLAIKKKADPMEPDTWVNISLTPVPEIKDGEATGEMITRRRVYGAETIEAFLSQHGFTKHPSYYTCTVTKVGDEVKVNMVHSVLPTWNRHITVPFSWDWSDKFLARWRSEQRAANRESHIANLANLTV
jgi:hypothetical protein